MRGLPTLREPLPAGPSDPADVLALLDDVGSPATMAMAGPRFFGFVIGGSLPAALAANWLAAAWDQNAAFDSVTPAVSALESRRAGLAAGAARAAREHCAGAFVTGATMANFSALAAARHAVLAAQGWDVEADGLFGAPPITVVIGEEAHPTLIKALGLVGFGRNRLVRVPVDGQGRMRADALPPLTAADDRLRAGRQRQHRRLRSAAAIAGAHARGRRLAARRRRVRPVGGRGSARRAHLLAGSELADSWATDAHKWLNVPYDSGSPSCATPMRCARRWP